jgi:hypothetical protein
VNREPQPEKQSSFWLELGGKRLNCTPENTDAYLYEDQTYDHIFHTISLDEQNNRNGFYIFRPMLDDETFDNLVRHMINNGFDVQSLIEPDEADKRIYISKYGEPPAPVELIKPKELTPRQERFATNHGLFLQHIEVTAEDFI